MFKEGEGFLEYCSFLVLLPTLLLYHNSVCEYG
jgi:hypothetical protein